MVQVKVGYECDKRSKGAERNAKQQKRIENEIMQER